MTAVCVLGAPLTIPASPPVPVALGWLWVILSTEPWCSRKPAPPPSTFPSSHEANDEAQPAAPTETLLVTIEIVPRRNALESSPSSLSALAAFLRSRRG